MDEPAITLIAAVARNGVIGIDDGLPWRIRADMHHFKASTLGKPLIFGRKTFAAMNGPLAGRAIIVVTKNSSYTAAGVMIAHSLDAAIATAREICATSGADEIMIGGGGAIYAEAMEMADTLLITHIDADVAGDTVFPEIDPRLWAVAERRDLERHDGDTAMAHVVTYRRRD